ncbi:MAG: PorP/SprF family type IX secretion system membrane protein [Bacteroidetes bacterium]|nr:PorP/SprF family type IX secretion system membrane protein [Bacteroidota bacterium]
MRKTLHIFIFLLLAVAVSAQQEAIFSHFFYNKTLMNPGAAGSSGTPCLTAVYRQQWAGLEGAPVTQALSFHSPVFAGRVGLGLTVANERIGFFNSTFAQAAYAYRVSLGGGKLGIGMHASYLQQQADLEQIRTISGRPGTDGELDGTTTVFNVGAGAHFENEQFFAGVAVPHLLERSALPGSTPHLFVTAGTVLHIFGSLDMRAATAVRLVKNAPPSVDAHVSFGFLEETKLWLGGTLRLGRAEQGIGGDALVAMAQYHLGERLRAGLAYDVALNGLRQQNQETFELVLEYCFWPRNVKVRYPRYF